MQLSGLITAICAAPLACLTMAQTTPPPGGGYISACHSQQCDGSCEASASANAGFPDCVTHDSRTNLGPAYAAASGHGYDVWWNSGKPDDTCRIVVRSPARTDLPLCGNYVTSWSQAGCYYTAVLESFILQYCCGTGDCDAASPARSMADAKAQAMMGNTTFVNLDLSSMFAASDTGTQDIDGIGQASWKRSDHAYSRREDINKPSEIFKSPLHRRDCAFHPTSDRITEGGRQARATPSQECNTPGGCSISVATAVSVGRTISGGLNIGEGVWNAISATLGYSFTVTRSYTVTAMFMQTEGTSGYVSFIPTNNCWDGTFSDCKQTIGDEIVPIDEAQSFHVCTPAKVGGDEDMISGTYTFVYEQVN